MEKSIRVLSEKILKLKSTITTEEATKTSFILPLIQSLGYDIFNPKELIAEIVSDIGSKKGEKCDYQLSKDNNPIVIIECKKWSENLDSHKNQLIRYYHTSKVKFGLLTNGIEYQFFSDFDQPNIMDNTPFFIFNILDFNDSDLQILKLFSKNIFKESDILLKADSLRYLSKIKNIVIKELSDPSKELSELIIRQVYNGRLTQKVFENFGSLVKIALNELFPTVHETNEEKISGIETTEEELKFYKEFVELIPEYKSILSYKDFKGHFSIIVNESPRKVVCKALFNSKNKYVILIDDKNETKLKYESIDNVKDYIELIKRNIENLK